MLDPDATQFRDVRRCTGDDSVWSGDVNGKNSFGAYTGFKPFFYSAYAVAYSDDSSFMHLMERCYSDLPKEPTDSASMLPVAVVATPKSEPIASIKVADEPMDDIGMDEDAGSDEPEPVNMCWGDYCPCDTSDPDYGYADITLCRNLRMAVPVSDAEFSIGAGGRDARRALREFDERNP